MALDLSPYATAKPFLPALETWLPTEDAERIATYALYEAIYRNVPDAFKIVQRGSDSNPVYIPSGKTIVEACNRYLAKGWDFSVDPRVGTDQEQKLLSAQLRSLFIREEMYAKFATQKKFGLIRGDAVWHITADPNKEPGTRLSIHEIDPASYFPIADPVNDEKVVGCHLVDQFDNGKGSTIIRRQTYRKEENLLISYEVSWWELAGWDDREGSSQELKPVPPPPGFTREAAFTLPPQITTIPVYHVKNERTPGSPFGSSELVGIERVIAGVTQAISDQELALALEGLGLYATTSGPPVDEDDEETNWFIGPGRVVEHDEDSEFKRVNGVGSVTPVLDHVNYLDKAMREASGTPNIAIGRVDQAVAESGIALALEMSPLISKNEEKEQVILSKMDHMLHDLVTMWLPAYEAFTTAARAVSIVDDPMPMNRKAILDEIILLLTSNLISIAYAQQLLSEKLGYEFPTEMLSNIVTEQAALAEAKNRDPFTARIASELDEQERGTGDGAE